MFRGILLTALCAMATASTGCGTISNQNGHYWYMTCATHPRSELYGGVKQDLGALMNTQSRDFAEAGWGWVFQGAIACIDLPFSAIGDTLTLPYDVWVTVAGRKETAKAGDK
jgi:uncharacterized protein YceK